MLTREAPALAPEVISPIKLSEALRLGRLIAPRHIIGAFYDGKAGACAAGAIALGLGWRPGPDGVDGGDLGPNVECNLFMKSRVDMALNYAIQDHNDFDRWSDDQIAGWLESQGL